MERTEAHVFIIADPISAPDRLLIPIIEPPGDYFQGHLLEFANRALARAPRVEFSPKAETAQATDRRGDGWALTTHRLQRGRIVDPDTSESSVLELELSERGAIRLFSGRGSDRNENGRHVVFESGLAGLCHQVLGLVGQVAEEAGYWSSWDLGFAMTRARGVISYVLVQHRMLDDNVPVFPDDGYESTTRATLEEITARPNAVVERLVGRLIRALGAREAPAVRELLD